jgi:hypothetical protein
VPISSAEWDGDSASLPSARYSGTEAPSERLVQLRELLGCTREEALTLFPERTVLLREGPLRKLNRDAFSRVHFVLTAAALLYLAPDPGLQGQLRVKRTMPLASLLAEHADQNRPQAVQEFKLMSPSKSFIVSACSEVEAVGWLQDIQAAAG